MPPQVFVVVVINIIPDASHFGAFFILHHYTDFTLECIATLLFLLETNGPLSEDDLVKQFKLWSEDKASRFSETMILNGIAYLCDTGVIEDSLIGYSIV